MVVVLATLVVPTVTAQKINDAAFKARLEKSDAEIANPKKSGKAATWINRAKICSDAITAPTKGLFAGLDEGMLAVSVGTQPSEVKDGVYEFERIKVHTKGGKVLAWSIKSEVLPNAYQIATENNLPDAYYNKVVPNLVSIYTKYGANKTILALSSCVLPIRGKRWGEQYFSNDEFYAQEWNDFNVKHNKNIERLMNYMKLSDDKDNISKVALFLTTEYHNGTKDVNAIKAKFGL